MLLPDVPVNINGFTPQNFSMQFEGAVPASEALARSLNIPAVTMLQRYGVPKFHSFLQQIGLKTINRSSSHYGLSLILGGAEATLWDVTNAYAMMGRSLLQLPQRSCSLLLPTSRITESTDPFQPGAVWQTFDALKEVNRPEEIDWKSIPRCRLSHGRPEPATDSVMRWAVGADSALYSRRMGRQCNRRRKARIGWCTNSRSCIIRYIQLPPFFTVVRTSHRRFR